MSPFNFSFFSLNGWGVDLDYRGIVWFALETDHFVVFETAYKYCILDSFVDYDGYSISSKGFLPTVADITKSYINLKYLNMIKMNVCILDVLCLVIQLCLILS